MNQHHLSRFDDAIPTTLGAVVRPVEQPKPAPVPANHFVEAEETMRSDYAAKPMHYYTQHTYADPLGQTLHDARIRVPDMQGAAPRWMTDEAALQRQVSMKQHMDRLLLLGRQQGKSTFPWGVKPTDQQMAETATRRMQAGQIGFWYEEADDISPNTWEKIPNSPVMFGRWTQPSQSEQDAKNEAMASAVAVFEAGFASQRPK